MMRSSAPRRTCCFRSGPPRGPTFSSARCLQSSCSGRHQSLRTTPIIVKVSGMRGAAFAVILALCPLVAASVTAQDLGPPLDAQLKQAEAEQAAAERQAAQLDLVASKARSEADRLH